MASEDCLSFCLEDVYRETKDGIRHPFAREAFKGGAGLKTVATPAGHAGTRTTERYAHPADVVGHLHQAAENAVGRPLFL